MLSKFSQSTGLFYDLAMVDKRDLPSDVIDVAPDMIQAALAARNSGGALSVVDGALRISQPLPPSTETMLVAVREDKVAKLQAKIAELEKSQHRMTRELLMSLLGGAAAAELAGGAAGLRLKRLETDVSVLRDEMASVLKAQSLLELDRLG